MRALRMAAVLAVAGALVGMSAIASGADGKRPRSLAVKADGDRLRASQGSWCYSGRRRAMCADYAYPLRIDDRLRVAPSDRVNLQFHDRSIASVSATLLRVRGRRIRAVGELDDVERVPANPRAWRATIPEDVSNANAIDVFVRYEDHRGDSNWWAGIRLGK
jgi:hypothetical protein